VLLLLPIQQRWKISHLFEILLYFLIHHQATINKERDTRLIFVILDMNLSATEDKAWDHELYPTGSSALPSVACQQQRIYVLMNDAFSMF